MSENRPQMTVQSAVEVVAAVVDVEQGEKVLRIYREEQAPVDFVCMAHSTARAEMLDLLGIGETAKAIVMCMVSRQTGVRLLKRLGRELEMRSRTRNRVCHSDYRHWSAVAQAADRSRRGAKGGQPDAPDEKNDGFDVVAVVMERGYTNVAMDAARKAGARGGTSDSDGAVLRKMRLNDFSVSKFRPKRKSCFLWCEAMSETAGYDGADWRRSE